MSDSLESLARQLEASPDYRVLRRFVPPSRYHEGDGSPTATGVVVDVETTGLDPTRDKIIEFCGVPFEFERESGRILAVREAVSYLEDPGRPIPAEVTKLTGITDAMVAGKRIDEAAVGNCWRMWGSSLPTTPRSTGRSWTAGSRPPVTRPGPARSGRCPGRNWAPARARSSS